MDVGGLNFGSTGEDPAPAVGGGHITPHHSSYVHSGEASDRSLHYLHLRLLASACHPSRDISILSVTCFYVCFHVPGKITEEEKQLCKTLMAYWANFMRTG